MKPDHLCSTRCYKEKRKVIRPAPAIPCVHAAKTHFCPNHLSSAFSATHRIPSYSTALDSATALHQNDCASILKSRTTARVTLLRVNGMGRPSPSSRARVAKYDHHGWPFPLMPPDACASMTKSRPVTTNQEAWSWMKMTR